MYKYSESSVNQAQAAILKSVIKNSTEQQPIIIYNITFINVTAKPSPIYYDDNKVYVMDHVAHKNNNLSQYYASLSIGHPLKLRIVSNSWNLCAGNGSGLDVFIYVFIRANGFEFRENIRNTWANRTLFPTVNVGFVIGLSADPDINLKIVKENEQYGDVIQGDYLDTYRNLTFKSIMTWRWIKYNCMGAKYTVKIDDDMLPHIPNLLAFLRNKTRFNPPRLSFACRLWTTMGPIRDVDSKYYLSREEWPLDAFLPYCSGVAFVTTIDVPSMLYDLSFTTKMIWIDDVNNGVVAAQNKDIKFLSEPVFYIYDRPWSFNMSNRTFDWVFFYLPLIGDEAKDHRRLWELVVADSVKKGM
jgi:beta-1,3-galactosyltransferase 1